MTPTLDDRTRAAMLFRSACDDLLAMSKADPYAQAYAKHGYNIPLDKKYDEERRVQALYIVTNMGHMRGEQVKTLRAVFKAVSTKVWR